MANVEATVAAAGAAAVIGARPPEEVVIWAIFGGVVAVWLNHKSTNKTDSFSRWALHSAAMVLVSALCGILLSAILMQLAPHYYLLGVFSHIERWETAAIIAALAHKAGPKLERMANAWAKKKTKEIAE